jgi:sulfide:quinone oxidoreductase
VGFALAPALARHDIRFIHAEVERIEPERRVVRAGDQEIPYDFLIVATGPQVTDIPASGNQDGVLHAIHTESGALATRDAVERLLEHPGPAVVGLARGAGYLSAAYDFVLQLDYELRRRGRRDHATIAFVTPEVHLGYLGAAITGARRIMEGLFARRRITVFTGAIIDHVADEHVYLHDGTRLPAVLAVVLPEVGGVPAILRSAGLTDEFGFIPVDAQYRHQTYPEIYAAGLAARLQAPSADGVPSTAYLAAAAGRAVAMNLAAVIRGGDPTAPTLPRLADLGILDGGDAGVLLVGAGAPLPFHVALPLPGRVAHWANEALLRYLLWKLRVGRTDLP